MQQKLRFSMPILLGLYCIVALLSAPAVNAHYKGVLNKADYCFIQSAEELTITVDKSTGKKGVFKLTLTQVHPYLTYFSDRPDRVIGKMSTKEFLKLWTRTGPNNFQNDPPNASVTGLKDGFLSADKSLNFVFKLSNPQYDPQTHILTYTATPLNDQHKSALLPQSVVTLQHVTLFIDDVCLSCWGM